MKIIKKQYRLCMVIDRFIDDDFLVSLADKSENNYGPDYRSEEIFDTEEECLQHAFNSDKWKWDNFTILPVYRFVEK